MTDRELLTQYARDGDPKAFETLVHRHVNAVYGAARRQMPEAAEDVTQAVFLLLARKASTIPPDAVLAGWLHRAVRYCCANARKAERRRKHHEQKAAAMMTQETSPRENSLLPMLDDALESLGRLERDAVLLRYLQGQSMEEAGRTLGISAGSAAKRASRGLDKLRVYFGKLGYAVPGAAVAELITAEAAKAAPAVVAPNVIAAISSAAASPAAIQLMKGAHMLMTLDRIKAYAFVAAMVLLAVGGAAFVFSQTAKTPPATATPPSVSSPKGVATATAPLQLSDVPFPEFVGCRQKAVVAFHIGRPMPKDSQLPTTEENAANLRAIGNGLVISSGIPYGSQIEFRWTAGPVVDQQPNVFVPIDQFMLGVMPAFSGPPPVKPDTRTGWQLAHIPGATRSIIFGKKWDGTDTGTKDLQPGFYALQLVAHTNADDQAANPLAIDGTSFTVNPPELLLATINDLQPDGTIHSRQILHEINTSGAPLTTIQFHLAAGERIEKAEDDAGKAVAFKSDQEAGGATRITATLNAPAGPGEAYFLAFDATLTSAVTHPAGGPFELHATTDAPAGTPRHLIQIYRVPAGAKLIDTTPAALPVRVVDGRTEVLVDRQIDPAAWGDVRIRYAMEGH